MRYLPALIIVLLAVNAAAFKITVAGQTSDINPLNPALPIKPGGGRPGGSYVPTIVDAICPLSGATDTQIRPFPIKSDDVCGSFGLSAPNNAYACLTLGQMLPILGNPPLRCAPDAIPAHPNTDPNGSPIPQPLPDRRVNGQLPKSFNTADMLAAEGATYSWLHSVIQRIYLWSTCAEQGNNVKWQAPEGWTLNKMVHIANGNNVGLERMHGQQVASSSMPFMAILQQDAAARAGSSSKCRSWASKAAAGTATAADNLCEGGLLLFALRGTATAYEWTVDFQYNTRPDPNYGPGRFHDGFLRVADQLWDNGMKEALDTAVAAGDVSNIIISGHSLGAAAANLLASRAQAYLDKSVASRQSSMGAAAAAAAAPTITVVTFGLPNVGDAAFAAHFDRIVNARNVAFTNDIVRQVPCAPQITGCNHISMPVPTAFGPHGGAFSYTRLGGEVLLTFDNIPVQREVWKELNVMTQADFCRTQNVVWWSVDVGHYCSYFCSLGAYVGQNTWCKLWEEPEGSAADQAASYCFAGVPGAAYPKPAPGFPVKH